MMRSAGISFLSGVPKETTDGVSRTALAVAGARWLETESDTPLCHDPWAGPLAGDDGRTLAQLLDRHTPEQRKLMALRTAYLDREVAYHIEDLGIQQVVILGAGLDTRAARLGAPGVRFFEVDRGPTQADKLRRLGTLPDYPTDAASYVPCDLATDDLFDRLAEAGFSAHAPALVLMEGLSVYLTTEAVAGLLRTVATQTHPESQVIFDYLNPRLRESEAPDQLRHLASRILQGEPMRWFCEDPLPLLRGTGFQYVRTSNLDAFCLQVTGELGRRWGTHLYSIAHAARVVLRRANMSW